MVTGELIVEQMSCIDGSEDAVTRESFWPSAIMKKSTLHDVVGGLSNSNRTGTNQAMTTQRHMTDEKFRSSLAKGSHDLN